MWVIRYMASPCQWSQPEHKKYLTTSSSIQSHWRERTKCSTPLLQRQCCPTLTSVTGICLYLSGQATCWQMWRGHTGSPLTKGTSQVTKPQHCENISRKLFEKKRVWYQKWYCAIVLKLFAKSYKKSIILCLNYRIWTSMSFEDRWFQGKNEWTHWDEFTDCNTGKTLAGCIFLLQ